MTVKGRKLLLLQALARHWVGKGRAPTYRDLMADAGWFTPGAVSYNVNQLWRDGYVDYEPGESRSLRLTSAGWAASGSAAPSPCPLCAREAP